MTVHTWKPTNTGFILDPTNYADGTAFAAGDTLVINGGGPNAQSISGNVVPLTTGNYQFNPVSASTSLQLVNIQLDAGSTLSVVGPQVLAWQSLGQFVTDGAIQVGSATAPGSVLFSMYDLSLGGPPATVTNTGSITLQNGSRFQTNVVLDNNDVILNAAGALISVNSGSVFYDPDPAAPLGVATASNSAKTTNNGLIEVNGVAGQSTMFYSQGNYSGAGLLSVRGAPGAAATDTSAQLVYGGASGVFDIASGELAFTKSPNAGGSLLAGTVNFLDANGVLSTEDPSLPGGGNVASATVNGFQAGDRIVLVEYSQSNGFSYDPATHKLTIKLLGLEASNQPLPVQFTFAGNYTQADFQVTTKYEADGLHEDTTITTTSKANAMTPFSFQDTKTGAAGGDAGQQYTGGVNYLQSQYIWAGQDSVNIAANLPNVFIKGGPGDDALTASAGSNVLDGGFGSNFIVGASGADGGRDTFFLDGTAGTTWDTIMNFHPGDSATLWGYVAGTSAMLLTGNEGAAGHMGATIHAAFAGAGTAINGSLTFAGLSLADAQTKLTMTSGNAGGRSYLYVHYNG